jgi:hypothetical protein
MNAPFDTSLPSPISRLEQLRAGASEAVVRDENLSDVQQLMARWGPLEDAIWEALKPEANRRLLVLTGSAGSGKSATLNHLLKHEAETKAGHIGQHLADATHSDAPDRNQVERLAEFFAPFADGAPEPDGPCRAIAMNTGMALRFFTDLPGLDVAPELSHIETLLRRRLNLPPLPGGSVELPGWMPDAIVVVNLDHRMTAGTPGALFEQILSRFDPSAPDGVLEGAARCSTCRVSDRCWPMANATAISSETGRRALNVAAGDVALARGRQLAPRALWDAAAELALGGLNLRAGDGDDPCFAIANLAEAGDESLLVHAMASNGALGPVLLEHGNLVSAGEGSLVADLALRDPSYNATRTAHELIADAGIDPDSDADTLAENLSGAAEPHPAVTRAAQVLRQGKAVSEDGDRVWGRVLARAAWLGGTLKGRSGLSEDFAEALIAQAAHAAEFDGTPAGKVLERALSVVEDGLASVFGLANGPESYYPTSTPTPGAAADLMVMVRLVDDNWLKTRPDPIQHANPLGARLVEHRPLTLSLEVADRPIAVDYPLWQLLRDAALGAAPSTVDLERFLALRQAIRLVGVRAAEKDDRPLLVRDRGPGGRKFRIITRNAAARVLRATEAL